MLAGLMILGGVTVALSAGQRRGLPDEKNDADKPTQWRLVGLGFALLAGFGQGCGATLSRRAHALAVDEGRILDGIAQAFVRTIPGVAFALLAWAVFQITLGKSRCAPVLQHRAGRPLGEVYWLLGAALFGPVLGVSCFQWALSGASSAMVLSVTATAPVIIMPLAAYIEDDRPGWPAVIGAAIAVVGVAWLALLAA
jgi:drug/metabolite transporter (DMT)-like permease